MNAHFTSFSRHRFVAWFRRCRMTGAGISAAILTACATSDIESRTQQQCFLSEAGSPVTKVCRVFSLTDWETLGLQARDPVSARVLDGMTRAVRSNEVSANYYPTFVKQPASELPITIVDNQGWTLEAILESTANKASCSYVREADDLLREYGGDDQGTPEDKKQGKRCGNIAIIHSLLRLGVLTQPEAFRGEFLNPEIVGRLDQLHGDEPGMTPDQQQRGYAAFNTADAVLNCNTTWPGRVSEKGSVLRVASLLHRTMQSEDPKYDCSLGIHADEQYGSSGFQHVEHVTGVSVTEDGRYLITTIDGFEQGESADKIPKTPATNTWTVSGAAVTGGTDWIQLQDSTSPDVKRRYSDIAPHWIEMRCCQVVGNSGQQ